MLSVGLLTCCNQAESSTQESIIETDTLKEPENLEVGSTKPIHAVGGKIEEDPDDLNHNISAHGGGITPEEIMEMYCPHEVNPGGKEEITMTKQDLDDGNIKVTLIDDNMEDDSRKTSKIEITMEPIGVAWKVLKIEKQWKCYEARGHTDWGIQSCN
jgi:hypothetical protein